MRHFNFSKLFDNKTFCMIFSIVGAVLIWASVTLASKDSSEKVIRNVPIDFSVSGTAVEALGLSAFEHSADDINITLSGNRGTLNSISKDDFIVSLSLGRITSAGKHSVNLDVSLKQTFGNVNIIDYSPKSIQINFDRNASKTLQIEVDISSFSAKEGYMLDKGYPSSQEVTISGPENIINSVDKCIVDVGSKKTILDETFFASKLPLVLYDSNGKVISSESITMDKETVDVSVPTLKIKEMPVAVQFINAPAEFIESSLKYSLSVSKIKLAGPEETINELSQFDLRYVDLKTVKPGDKVSLNVELPSAFVNVDNISSIDITILGDNLTEKTFNASQFKLINAPESKKINIVSDKLNNIRIFGEKSFLNEISASNIVIEVDVSEVNITSGTMNVPAEITIPGKSGLFWVYGSYSAIISVG